MSGCPTGYVPVIELTAKRLVAEGTAVFVVEGGALVDWKGPGTAPGAQLCAAGTATPGSGPFTHLLAAYLLDATEVPVAFKHFHLVNGQFNLTVMSETENPRTDWHQVTLEVAIQDVTYGVPVLAELNTNDWVKVTTLNELFALTAEAPVWYVPTTTTLYAIWDKPAD